MATKKWVGTDTGNVGDWATAANWSPSGVPANGDDVFLEDSSQSVTEGFDQSAVALASLHIAQTYTGTIGDDTSYLQIGATAVDIGYHYGIGSPLGSGRVKVNLGNTAATVIIHNTGTSTDTNKPTVRLKCNNAATTLEVRKGSAGLAFETTETSTIGTITISYSSQVSSDADVFIGSGVTLTTLNITGGDTTLGCAATTVAIADGTLETVGSGVVATLNVSGGQVESNSSGTITACNISGGTCDFTKSATARTVTTLKLEAGGTLVYDPDILTITNKVASDNPVTLTATAV